MSSWPPVTLGEIARQDITTVEVEGTVRYPVVGVLNRGRGLLVREPILGSDTAYKTLNVIRAGQIVYSRLKAFEGAITVVPSTFHSAYASQEFPTFTCGPDLLPEFFNLLTTTPALWATLQNLSTGMGGRRERVKPAAFLTIKIGLPPLAEQRRIVAVMAAVDDQIKGLEAERQRAESLLDRIATQELAALDGRTKYGLLATTRSGPSWSSGAESKVRVDGSTRVLKITNTKRGNTLDLSDETYVVGLPMATTKLDDSSLIIIRTNGNRDRIGNVYRSTSATLGCAVSAFQFVSKANTPQDRDFLYWALRDPSLQQRMSEAASGSTGLGNLAVKWLNAVEVPWTNDVEERSAIVARLDAVEHTVAGLAAELASLRAVRAALLSDLLSQEITVDDAVDQFVEQVA